MRERFPPRTCPVCGDPRFKPLYRQSFEHFLAAGLLDGYDVVICRRCGAGYADDIPPQAAFDDYYRDLSKYDEADRSPLEPSVPELRFQHIADILETLIPQRTSRIFEIGCASGQLLSVLRARGFESVLGCDPSPGCVRSAAEFYGVPAVVGTVFSAPQPERPFDFLILGGVMEHIRDLDRAVAQLARLLSDGGRVYIEVPDASRYVWHADAPFQEFSTEHINFFSGQSLTNLMLLRGFRALAVGHAIRPHHEIECPTVYGVFGKSATPAALVPDTGTETGLSAYIEGCRKEHLRILARIEQSLAPGERMIVWGVGTHTLRLLAAGGLDPARVVVFADSNPNYQNQQLRGVSVVPPDALKSHAEPILISSRGFQREIQDQIRHKLGLPNRLILLYD